MFSLWFLVAILNFLYSEFNFFYNGVQFFYVDSWSPKGQYAPQKDSLSTYKNI